MSQGVPWENIQGYMYVYIYIYIYIYISYAYCDQKYQRLISK